MHSKTVSVYNKGCYLIQDATRILRAIGCPLSRQRLYRIFKPFHSTKNRGGVVSKPILEPELPQKDANIILSFKDLLELQCISMFLEYSKNCSHRIKRITRENLRIAHERACREYNTKHPFLQRRFLTDGISIFAHDDDGNLRNFADNGYAISEILEPFLRDVEYDNLGNPVLLRPRAYEGKIVIDPTRRFGQPILDAYRIPTSTLYEYHKDAGEPISKISRWFKIPVGDVETAITFEKRAS